MYFGGGGGGKDFYCSSNGTVLKLWNFFAIMLFRKTKTVSFFPSPTFSKTEDEEKKDETVLSLLKRRREKNETVAKHTLVPNEWPPSILEMANISHTSKVGRS